VVTTAVSTVRASLDTFLGSTYGADVVIDSAQVADDGRPVPLDPAVADAVRSVDGVLAAGGVLPVSVEIGGPGGTVISTSAAAPTDEAAATLADRDLPAVGEDEILMPPSLARTDPQWLSGAAAEVRRTDPFADPTSGNGGTEDGGMD